MAADDTGAVVLAGGGEVRALDPEGATAWRTDVPGAALQAPALDDAVVAVGAGDRIVALERGDGSPRWELPVPDGAAGPVALVGEFVVAGTEAGALVAIDTATGETRWTRSYAGAVRAAPVAGVTDDGAAVVATWHGGADPRLRAFDHATGEPRWDAPIPGATSAPAVHQGVVVVGEGDGRGNARVVGRAVDDGTELWSAAAPASFESSITPGAEGGDVAVVDHFGTVSVVDAHTGAGRLRVDLDAAVLRTTVLVTGALVALTTHAGDLVLIDRRSGRIRHRSDPGGFPVALAASGPDLLVALRIREPGRVEALRARPGRMGAETRRLE